MIPVVFPENLSQPLAFEKGTIFPWGLRSEKHELLPYEIYQTNDREIAFLRYDYTKDHINAASYCTRWGCIAICSTRQTAAPVRNTALPIGAMPKN